MPQRQTFKPLDAMVVRTQLGHILDQVELTNQRYQIMRRGKVKALLVPVNDQKNIEAEIREAELDRTYQALQAIKGIIKDPNLKDASSTIDDHLYGTLAEQEVDE